MNHKILLVVIIVAVIVFIIINNRNTSNTSNTSNTPKTIENLKCDNSMNMDSGSGGIDIKINKNFIANALGGLAKGFRISDSQKEDELASYANELACEYEDSKIKLENELSNINQQRMSLESDLNLLSNIRSKICSVPSMTPSASKYAYPIAPKPSMITAPTTPKYAYPITPETSMITAPTTPEYAYPIDPEPSMITAPNNT